MEQERADVTPNQPPRATTIPQPADSHNPSVGEILANTDPIKAKKRQEQIGNAMESANVPIDFYGQTIDQDGNPLSGVQVKAIVRHWTASLQGTSVRVDRTSDSNGFFDIHDVTGDAFDLESMGKEGYELEPGQRTFGPSGGAPVKPVIFKLWNKLDKQPMVSGRDALDILADGRMYAIGITNNTMTEGNQGNGDLTVWVKRPDGVTWSTRFDWSCELQIVNGGLCEELNQNSPMYVAPTDGYTNGFHFDARNGWGKSTGTRRFYLRLENGGRYGRASVEILPYFDHQEPGLIRIEYAINPTGSHILH